MWRVYLLEFIIIVILSIIWVKMLDDERKNN